MKTLYDVTITFDPAESPVPVKNVALVGEFLFYQSNLTGHTDKTGMVDCDKKYTPHEYREGLDSIGGLYQHRRKENRTERNCFYESNQNRRHWPRLYGP